MFADFPVSSQAKSQTGWRLMHAAPAPSHRPLPASVTGGRSLQRSTYGKGNGLSSFNPLGFPFGKWASRRLLKLWKASFFPVNFL